MKNQVIKVLGPAHGARVIEYWRSQGVNTDCYSGDSTGSYYGVIRGLFGLYTKWQVLSCSAEIIELPKEKVWDFYQMESPYPKVMWVWDTDKSRAQKRVVFMEKCGGYLAWASAETLEEAEGMAAAILWNHAKDIEEPTIKEVTLEEVAQAMGISVEQLRIRK